MRQFFICVLLLFIFLQNCHTHLPPLHSLWFSLCFLHFIIVIIPRTKLQYAMSISYSTQYNLEHTLCYF